MKTHWMTTAAALATALLLSACGGGRDADHTITVAANPVPHGEVLEQTRPILKAQGYELDIKVVNDYIVPNTALANDDVDANFFQHEPYMNTVIHVEHKGDPKYDFVKAGGYLLAPIGIYSKHYKRLQDLPDGAKVLMRNAVADEGRVLAIFQREGLIKLNPNVPIVSASVADIIDNPKHLDFRPNIEASMLPAMYRNDEGDAIVINANFALGAGLDPVHDPIAVEASNNNPYINIVAVRRGHEHDPKVEALLGALRDPKVQQFVIDKYKGAIIPVND
ncbi:MetQ/NlpA family ABC transporter substrate-binding protein [Zymobacter palmae]|uniref:Lipoprotein n=1 Tax=Zymobacter palmae TaxID=33074 RepID=A0A348HD80_9GAMM|nr:MetQ/NlpA family ABC transporter substrate-binding protein [Zymobacter palmae]BBG29582.1 lipoprotein [Zymobacter palmae]